MSDKSTLTEIDRLEGIAQAYKRARPGVYGNAILDDCTRARELADELAEFEGRIEESNERLQELLRDLTDAAFEQSDAQGDFDCAEEDLSRLMASLSAKLER